MYAAVLAFLLASGSSAFDGYTAVIDLLNHRWTTSCSSPIRPGNTNPHSRLKNVVGLCQPKIEVLHLPPNYRPNWLLNANCAEGCFRSRCAHSALYSCQEVRKNVQVINSYHEPQNFVISMGCVCAKILNEPGEFRPPMVL